MDISTDRLDGLDKREILELLVQHVTTTEEQQDEKEYRSGSSTDLNLYILDNIDYQVGRLDGYINEITDNEYVSGYAKNFVKEHTFAEELLNTDISYIHVTTPEKSRIDDCIWMVEDGYVWVLTTERQEWRKKTIENLIKYLPQVERIYLSSNYLEDLADTIPDSYISGFTAEYHAPYADREATLRFHGGREEDLEKAEKVFNAKPTRIEFDQTNSPTAAIQGAGTNQGRITVQAVVDGSQEKAVETLVETSSDYQSLDGEGFAVGSDTSLQDIEKGFAVEGFTALELVDPDRPQERSEDLLQDLKDEVLNSRHFKFGHRDEKTLRVCDSRYGELYDIALEPPNIIIYPRPSATAVSLRAIVKEIFEFDSTYEHRKVEGPVASD